MTHAKGSGFLKLDHDLLRSEQFGALSGLAKLLFVGMADQFNGRNNNEITFSVRQAETWLHSGRATAVRRFRELEDAGYIEAVERGSFCRKSGQGRATKWRLNFL